MNDERDFLHNLATPLATAYMAIDVALEMMRARKDADKEELEQLTSAFEALEKLNSMVIHRREILIKPG